MAMTLRLTDDETAELRQYAETHGMSMQEAAREGVRKLVHNDRRDAFSRMVRSRDSELLERLSK